MKILACLLLLLAVVRAQSQRPVEEFSTQAGPVKITPIRHASLMIQAAGQTIYVDPAQGSFEGLPQADLILITHAHGDHLNEQIVAGLKKPGTQILGPEVVAKALAGTTLIRAGETRHLGQWKIEVIPAYNIKRQRPTGQPFHPKGEGVGYVLSYGGKRFYIAGDTEGIPEMTALKNIDVAFIPMNLPYTMSPEEAAEAVRAFKPKIVYPYHCRGTDLKLFEKALAGSGVEVRIRDWYY
jgi:L-ascorbate metabolism protein UlaG (beta-lactamase superfamily)